MYAVCCMSTERPAAMSYKSSFLQLLKQLWDSIVVGSFRGQITKLTESKSAHCPLFSIFTGSISFLLWNNFKTNTAPHNYLRPGIMVIGLYHWKCNTSKVRCTIHRKLSIEKFDVLYIDWKIHRIFNIEFDFMFWTHRNLTSNRISWPILLTKNLRLLIARQASKRKKPLIKYFYHFNYLISHPFFIQETT